MDDDTKNQRYKMYFIGDTSSWKLLDYIYIAKDSNSPWEIEYTNKKTGLPVGKVIELYEETGKNGKLLNSYVVAPTFELVSENKDGSFTVKENNFKHLGSKFKDSFLYKNLINQKVFLSFWYGQYYIGDVSGLEENVFTVKENVE